MTTTTEDLIAAFAKTLEQQTTALIQVGQAVRESSKASANDTSRFLDVLHDMADLLRSQGRAIDRQTAEIAGLKAEVARIQQAPRNAEALARSSGVSIRRRLSDLGNAMARDEGNLRQSKAYIARLHYQVRVEAHVSPTQRWGKLGPDQLVRVLDAIERLEREYHARPKSPPPLPEPSEPPTAPPAPLAPGSDLLNLAPAPRLPSPARPRARRALSLVLAEVRGEHGGSCKSNHLHHPRQPHQRLTRSGGFSSQSPS